MKKIFEKSILEQNKFLRLTFKPNIDPEYKIMITFITISTLDLKSRDNKQKKFTNPTD